MTEVMAQSQTDKRYFDELVDFANDIRMLALPVNKEKNGYLLNSMLVPWLLSGLDLYVSGVSDPKSIDLAWTRGTGAPKGPVPRIRARWAPERPTTSSCSIRRSRAW